MKKEIRLTQIIDPNLDIILFPSTIRSLKSSSNHTKDSTVDQDKTRPVTHIKTQRITTPMSAFENYRPSTSNQFSLNLKTQRYF